MLIAQVSEIQMKIHNDTQRYGLFSIGLHWLVALLIIGLFGLGLWMEDMDYYHSWYRQAPWLHKGLGALAVLLVILRIAWQKLSPRPDDLDSMQRWEILVAHAAHLLLNLLVLLLAISGYLIVTAKGDPLVVFDLFSIPALTDSIANLEDLAGEVHEALAWGLMALAGAHALAALKHHFINHDATLLRMLGRHQ